MFDFKNFLITGVIVTIIFWTIVGFCYYISSSHKDINELKNKVEILENTIIYQLSNKGE